MPLKKNQEIRLPGKRRMRWKGKDLRVLVNDDVLKKPRRMAFHGSIRLGYGESCEFHLGGEDGPPVVLELRKQRGPAHLSSPLSPEDLEQYVELSVDGEPVRAPARRLAPGSLLEVLDKRTDRRIRLLVDPPTFLLRHPRLIATLLGLAFLVAAGYGGYMQWSLNSTENRLLQAEVRLGKAERSVSEALGRLEATENQQARALREFNANKTAAERRLLDSFNIQFDKIRKDFSGRLAEISQEDDKARVRLEADTRRRIEALKTALSQRMVEAYNRAKSNEVALRKSVAARLAAVEPESRVFKRTYSKARNKVLFIRIDYKVRFEPSSQVREFDAYGTGFLMSSRGLGVTARHVLFPWEYDRQLTVFQKAGVAKLLPGSIRVTVWPTDRQAHDNNPEKPRYFFKRGYRSGGKNPSFRFLYAPRPERAEVVSNTPFGLVTVSVPKPGSTDIAVFHLKSPRKRLPFFRLAKPPLKVETLDEVMAVGYPFARLQNGVTIPQPARGIVRRIGGNLIELDTPLHPGVSGGPVVNRAGLVIGMAIGVMDSPVYGMAVTAKDIRTALRRARTVVRKDERRLRKLGCDPGRVDGLITGKTWAAYACEAAKAKR